MSKRNKGGGKKFNNIKPGTICTLIHNDFVIFRIIRINAVGYPFSDLSVYNGIDLVDITRGAHCVAYTDLYREATKEEKELFFKIVKEHSNEDVYFKK